MRPKKTFLLLCATLLFFTDCKKKETKTEDPVATTPTSTTGTTITPPVVAPVPKIKMASTVSASGTALTTYQYDTTGKLTKILYNNGQYTTLTWTNAMIVYKNFSSTNEEQLSTTYILNSNGQVKISWSNNTEHDYEYDADGYLAKQTYTSSGVHTIDYVTSNEDLNSISFFQPNETITYEYYTDKINTTGNANIGFNIFGKQNKHPEKTNTQTPEQGAPIVTSTTYDFDSQNRVFRKAVSSGGSTYTVSYIYE